MALGEVSLRVRVPCQYHSTVDSYSYIMWGMDGLAAAVPPTGTTGLPPSRRWLSTNMNETRYLGL
jgi:hypothetical protein